MGLASGLRFDAEALQLLNHHVRQKTPYAPLIRRIEHAGLECVHRVIDLHHDYV